MKIEEKREQLKRLGNSFNAYKDTKERRENFYNVFKAGVEEKKERLVNSYKASKAKIEEAKKKNFSGVIGKVTFVKRSKND